MNIFLQQNESVHLKQAGILGGKKEIQNTEFKSSTKKSKDEYKKSKYEASTGRNLLHAKSNYSLF